MKKNSKIVSIAVFTLCLGVYIGVFNGDDYKIIDKNQLSFEFEPNKVDPKIAKAHAGMEKSSPASSKTGRAPASVPRPVLLPEWQTKLQERLTHSLRNWDAKAEVKSLGPRTFKNGGDTIGAEHVLVSIDQGDGNVSSYEAYVHPKTGAILKTWNQTRFENKKPQKYEARQLDTAL